MHGNPEQDIPKMEVSGPNPVITNVVVARNYATIKPNLNVSNKASEVNAANMPFVYNSSPAKVFYDSPNATNISNIAGNVLPLGIGSNGLAPTKVT